MVFCTSLGKPDDYSHNFLLMTILVAIKRDEVLTMSTVKSSTILATSLPSSRMTGKVFDLAEAAFQ